MCGETKIMQTIEQCKEKYERYKAAGLKLDMSRGKPAADQLDLSRALLSQPGQEESCLLENGLDCRNYGLPPVCRPCGLCSPTFSACGRKM